MRPSVIVAHAAGPSRGASGTDWRNGGGAAWGGWQAADGVIASGVSATAQADPTVALLVERLEAAAADAGYFRQKADSHALTQTHPPALPLSVNHHAANSLARPHDSARWLGPSMSEEAGAWAAESAVALSMLEKSKMALRLQSFSTAAFTISLDTCWCKAELASVIRALEDYNELAQPEGILEAWALAESKLVGRETIAIDAAERMERQAALLLEREDEVAMLRALLEETRSSLMEKEEALAERSAQIRTQAFQKESLSNDAGGAGQRTGGVDCHSAKRAQPSNRDQNGREGLGGACESSSPSTACLDGAGSPSQKATSSFKGAAVQRLAAVFESGGNVVETPAQTVMFASGKVSSTLSAHGSVHRFIYARTSGLRRWI